MRKLPSFQFRSSYLNYVWFDVTDESGSYEVQLRVGTSDYERQIYNGSADDYERNCAALVGWLYKHGEAIPPQTVRAFNEWREAIQAEFIRRVEDHPERYGTLKEEDRSPTLMARGSAQWTPNGWKFEPVTESANV